MTSRRKIARLTHSAKQRSCSVILQTGKPPGIMIAEGREASVKAWVADVKALQYKDYRLLRMEAVDRSLLDKYVAPGRVAELSSMKILSACLGECGLLEWWTQHMGFAKGGA